MKRLIATTCFACALTTPAMAQMFSVEAFAGYAFENELEFNGNVFDVLEDDILGIRGLYNVTPEISVGLEYSRTTADFEPFFQYMDVDAVLAIARYSAPVTDTVDVYGTLGLGTMRIDFDQGGGFTEATNVAGGSITFGAHYAVNDTIGVFGEVGYRRAFEEFELVGDILEYNAVTANLGVRFRF